jgi:ubiquinone/menaquinone biosynthesis C-methylase UbiE
MLGYIHGYSSEEQDRLAAQARFLEPYVFSGVDFSEVHSLLEVGCGVGAQTQILLERFPQIKVTAIDHESAQILAAALRLSEERKAGRVFLEIADAGALPYRDRHFDAAFLCWILEHVSDPLAVLDEVLRILRPGGSVICTEVLNAPLATYPECAAIERYWRAYNSHQRTLGGDPLLGARLGEYLEGSGFHDVRLQTVTYHIDARASDLERKRFFAYWNRLFLSALPAMRRADAVTECLATEMDREFAQLAEDPRSLFFLVAMQAHAKR